MENVIIIAEAGVNHNGKLEMAMELIDQAAKSGANYVKFQTFKTENVVTKNAQTAVYQNLRTGETNQFKMLKNLELSEEDHFKIINRCNEKGIRFLSTPFDEDSIDFLADKVDFFKVPSGEITNFPFLRKIASYKKPVVVSTGMANMKEIEASLKVIRDEWNGQNPASLLNGLECLTVLQCTTAYPCPDEYANLNVIKTLQKEFNIPVGLSDHTLGLTAGIIGVAFGAKVIEKHFTLDKNLPGPDHKASLEPKELSEFVKSLRSVNLLLGDGVKKILEVEKVNFAPARKGLRYLSDFKEGHILSPSDFMIVRPCEGLGPDKITEITGLRLKSNVKVGQIVLETDFLA